MSKRAEVRRLLALPWSIELRSNVDGGFFARILELPGCMTEGRDERTALRNLRAATELWLETELERGAAIPEPLPDRSYSGKFTVRTSPLVHRMAAQTAERLGVSLNELASEALALVAGAGTTLRLVAPERTRRGRGRTSRSADARSRRAALGSPTPGRVSR